ncbi:MAG: 30S ribosomal protein S17 [Solirubrobacterales bacterium]
MAEEEKQEQETADEQAPEEEAAADATVPEEQAEGPAADADEAAEEEREGAPAEEPAAEVAEPTEEEPEEALSPKQLRKRERSRASGPAGPQRSAEERATERAERRSVAAKSRRRHRASRRRRRGEPGTGTSPAPREPGPRKVRQGTVVSTGGDKTITVEIAVVRRHPTYEKVVRRTSKLRAHDDGNEARQGDVVRLVESRPLSRTKRWRLLDVLERAPR